MNSAVVATPGIGPACPAGANGAARHVCSWQTSPDDVDDLVATLRAALA